MFNFLTEFQGQFIFLCFSGEYLSWIPNSSNLSKAVFAAQTKHKWFISELGEIYQHIKKGKKLTKISAT